MRVAFGCDHGGWALREPILETLGDLGHDLLDLGAYSPESSDYPDVAVAVARAVAGGEADLGVLICGTGIGMAMSANKVCGAYAANVSDTFSARMARQHNGANIVALGGRTLGPGLARELVRVFVAEDVDAAERHERRRQKIRTLEKTEPQ